ncbi:hypothetical protein B0J13DRAFT_34526 [Dactylonectria estremocensis]|uniref:Uncharacterized protein n=1 Tax=Dactylonectria estremocensis TaxID=1079267 RepID=A0A9P9FKB5_9HYPO|nr:hypothetical protein B0J13DRAFT_34526 [Dactylonectria estremocensis]
MNPDTPQNDQTNTTGRRRSSGFMPAFASLHEQKRGSDANAARRASMSDQEVKGGFISQFFHNNFGRNAGK